MSKMQFWISKHCSVATKWIKIASRISPLRASSKGLSGKTPHTSTLFAVRAIPFVTKIVDWSPSVSLAIVDFSLALLSMVLLIAMFVAVRHAVPMALITMQGRSQSLPRRLWKISYMISKLSTIKHRRICNPTNLKSRSSTIRRHCWKIRSRSALMAFCNLVKASRRFAKTSILLRSCKTWCLNWNFIARN